MATDMQEKVETFDKLLKSGVMGELAKPILYGPTGRVISGTRFRWVEEPAKFNPRFASGN